MLVDKQVLLKGDERFINMLTPHLALSMKLICFANPFCLDNTKKTWAFESVGVKLMRFSSLLKWAALT